MIPPTVQSDQIAACGAQSISASSAQRV